MWGIIWRTSEDARGEKDGAMRQAGTSRGGRCIFKDEPMHSKRNIALRMHCPRGRQHPLLQSTSWDRLRHAWDILATTSPLIYDVLDARSIITPAGVRFLPVRMHRDVRWHIASIR